MKYRHQGIWSELLPSLSWTRSWHTKEDNEILCKYAGMLEKDESILEIGSAEGQSTISLLLASESYIQIVEPFVVPNLVNNIRSLNLDHRVVIIPTTAEKAAIANIGKTGLLFIDAVHTYDMVKHDLEKFSQSDPRFIVLHDTIKPEVWRAVDEFLKKGTYTLTEKKENITVLSKVDLGE